MAKYLLQLMVGVAIFFVSTFFAWYESSEITENPFEWRYSTPFTNLFVQEIVNGKDISQLDYFVYAVKFKPLFPAIMFVSLIYLLSVLGMYLIKMKLKATTPFWGCTGLILLFSSVVISQSFTIGNSVFFWIASINGMIFLVVATLLWMMKMKHQSLEVL